MTEKLLTGTLSLNTNKIIWSACRDGEKNVVLCVCVCMCVCVCVFEEQQNVIYFILENEGDYEGYICKL